MINLTRHCESKYAKQTLCDQFIQAWTQTMSWSSKCLLYKSCKTEHTIGNYLTTLPKHVYKPLVESGCSIGQGYHLDQGYHRNKKGVIEYCSRDIIGIALRI